jgi:hypothetical protein
MLEETVAPDRTQKNLTVENSKVEPKNWFTLIGKFLLSPALAVFVFFGCLYFLTGSYFTKGISDGEVMAQTAVAIVQKHTVELPANPGLPQIVPGKNGLYFSKYGLGQPLLGAGLYWTGQRVSRFITPSDPNIIGHFFIMLLPPLATALTVWLVYLWGKGLYGSTRIGLGLAVLFGLGTSAWPYSKIFFSEALFTLTSFGAAFALWQARRNPTMRRRYTWIVLSGFLLGYSLMVKVSGIVLLPIYLLYLWYSEINQLFSPILTHLISKSKAKLSLLGINQQDRKSSGRAGSLGEETSPLQNYPATPNPLLLNSQHSALSTQFSSVLKSGLALVAGLFPGVLLILAHNYLRFGNPFNNGYDGEGFTTPIWKGLGGLLFSPGKSIFLYSPVLLALPFAVAGFWRRARAEALIIGLISLITLIYYSMWWAWDGSWSWGPRFLVPLLPFLVLPLGTLLQKSRFWIGVLFVGLLPLAVLVQMLGVAIDVNLYMIAISNNPALSPDGFVWKPEASPLVDHWSKLSQPIYNMVRALTLEQLGFPLKLGRIISLSIVLLFGLSGLSLCLNYLYRGKSSKGRNGITSKFTKTSK